MRGLKKIAVEEDKHTNTQTLRPLDQLGPEGPVGENRQRKKCNSLNGFHLMHFPTIQWLPKKTHNVINNYKSSSKTLNSWDLTYSNSLYLYIYIYINWLKLLTMDWNNWK